MPRTEAQKRADKKSRKKIYDQIIFKVRKDADINGDAIRAHAALMNESTNGFLKRAIKETMVRDKEKA